MADNRNKGRLGAHDTGDTASPTAPPHDDLRMPNSYPKPDEPRDETRDLQDAPTRDQDEKESARHSGTDAP